MEEVRKINEEALEFNLTLIELGRTVELIAFFQSQRANSLINAMVVNIKDSAPMLLLNGENSAFVMSFSTAQSIELERFFANSYFVLDTDRDLANISHFVPLQGKNIKDVKIAKNVAKIETKTFVPFFQINHENIPQALHLSSLKDLIIRGIKNIQSWSEIENQLQNQGKMEIYESIIAEKFMKNSVYHNQNANLESISSIYAVLKANTKEKVQELMALLHETASKIDVSISTLINLQALEAVIIKMPKTFDEISHISGLNKRLLHSAVLRKMLAITTKMETNLNRNRAIETMFDALLWKVSQESGIEKNLISNKHEIISFLNENQNVDFMKGWKKSLFGQKVLDFLNGYALIYEKSQGFVLVKNEKTIRRKGEDFV